MKLLSFLSLLIMSLFTANAQSVAIVSNLGTSPNIVVGTNNYNVTEALYFDAEIGSGNFVTAGTAIEKLNFLIETEGTPTAIGSFNIWMKNVPATTTTLPTAAYTRTGYTQVFSGTYNATSPSGVAGVTLTTPFVRTPGTNLQILIERLDGITHTGYVFFASQGDGVSATPVTSRRVNRAAAPVLGTTSLTASAFRPVIELVHEFAIDAAITDIVSPSPISCYATPQTIEVALFNQGLTPIAIGAASVTLKVSGANSYQSTQNNITTLAPGATELIAFTNIPLSNAGDNDDTAYVTLAGDGTATNDSAFSATVTASTIATYPIVEDAETSLPVFSYVSTIALNQLWTLQTGNYTNADLTTPLIPRAPGTTFYMFDSYSGANSTGSESRLYSNCITLPSPLPPNPNPVTTISFWMSHDNLFPTSLDSLYLSVSTDNGQNWTRLAGYQRYTATAATPTWTQEIVDVSAYNGQTVQFAFEGTSQYGNVIGLDDININYSGVVPVSLLTIDSRRTGNANQISWTTALETNSSRFEIEHSTDGLQYSVIGTVRAVGNSTTTNRYSYLHTTAVKGMHYYRIRMVDADSRYKLSQVRSVQLLDKSTVTIYPNPVAQTINMNMDAEKSGLVRMTLTDLSGRTLESRSWRVNQGSNSLQWPAQNLPSGNYIIQLDHDGSRQRHMIRKQ